MSTSTKWARIEADLSDAKAAAVAAAATGGDGGTCNLDNVRLFGIRWSKGLERALAGAGVRGHRRHWLGRACVELGFGFLGQAGANERACRAAEKLLRERGYDATIFWMVD